MKDKKYKYLSNALDELKIKWGFRKSFYSRLQKINICDEDRNPTKTALDLGLATITAHVQPYYSWLVPFVLNKLEEHGFSTESRLSAARSEYYDVYFSKKEFGSGENMHRPLTPTELKTILDPHTDHEGKPTKEMLEQNNAKLNPGFAIYSWDLGSVQKTFDYYTANKPNINLPDLVSYLNNNH